MQNMTVNEACRNQKVVYLPRAVKVEDVLSILISNNHNGFPVIDLAISGETLVILLILRVTYWYFCSRSRIFNIVHYLLKVASANQAQSFRICEARLQ
ncbi:chloride channel protein CLC-d-like isoform X2 [Primulina eburnea]|uniref:chloride channel protein CLC-d-like isoform X2 n=1 Tax=Primulina eburnea TaxID=1245227 RepID=UPI003C6C9CBA